MPRSLVRLLVLLAAAAAVLLPTAAVAHAELLGTTPGAGSVVPGAQRVVLRFDEPVTVAPDSIEVTDPDGRRVDQGRARAVGATARVGVRADVGGTYTVAWHVVSDDGHPEAGTYLFSVRHRSGHLPPVSRAGSASLGASYALLRWCGYAGFCALVGGTVFVLLCWPDAARLLRAELVAGGGGLLAWLAAWASLLLQGAYDDGTWTHLLRADTLLATLQSRTGAALMSRLLLLVVLGGVLVLGLRWGPLLRRGFRHRLLGAELVLVLVASATWSSAGHESVGPQWPLAVTSDAVHLTGVALWVGGLFLVVSVRPPLPAMATFSRTALPCVVAVAATGVYQAQRNLPGWAALTGTGYGRLVLAKVAGLLALVGLGHLARRFLARSSAARLGALVVVEVVVAAAVLGVAAVLVQTAPA